ncbi:MAG TPA: thermonuclease family protein [Candidatus Saccharimonadales bacterium]|nr:thermonuclease family protein [Candidatus Saccharimonadales bacterium]
MLPLRMRRKLFAALISVAIASIAALGQHLHWWQASTAPMQTASANSYTIDHFVDGDTIAVNMNGTIEKVRFIGVDTPETHKPDTPVQCYGPEAAAYTKKLIGNNRVRLEADSKSTDRDRYNRLLRYVYIPNGTNVNEALIQTGHGFYYPYFPFTKSGEFATAEQQAQAAHAGLWQACRPTPTDDGGYISNNQT